mgnify:CR=1 FL=1
MIKKRIINVLDNGLACVKDDIKSNEKDIDSVVSEFRKLHDLLYDRYTKSIVPMSYLVRFESRSGTIIKMLRKMDKWD